MNDADVFRQMNSDYPNDEEVLALSHHYYNRYFLKRGKTSRIHYLTAHFLACKYVSRDFSENGLDEPPCGGWRQLWSAWLGRRVTMTEMLETEADMADALKYDFRLEAPVDCVREEYKPGSGRSPEWLLKRDSDSESEMWSGGNTPQSKTTSTEMQIIRKNIEELRNPSPYYDNGIA